MKGFYLTITNQDAATIIGILGLLASFITVSLMYIGKMLKDKTETVTVSVKLDAVIEDIRNMRENFKDVWAFKSNTEKDISRIESNCKALHDNHRFKN